MGPQRGCKQLAEQAVPAGRCSGDDEDIPGAALLDRRMDHQVVPGPAEGRDGRAGDPGTRATRSGPGIRCSLAAREPCRPELGQVVPGSALRKQVVRRARVAGRQATGVTEGRPDDPDHPAKHDEQPNPPQIIQFRRRTHERANTTITTTSVDALRFGAVNSPANPRCARPPGADTSAYCDRSTPCRHRTEASSADRRGSSRSVYSSA
jgi:hypothetical protein